MPPLRPRRLAPGQTIGIVAPSAAPNDPERIRFAIDTVESLGFKVRPGAHLYDRDGYLAGSDGARADDVNAMFADDSVDAIWCVRGGYGASRLLPALDYGLMQRKPKALIGFSDITARLGAPPPFAGGEGQVDWDNRVTTLVPGKARGRLLGGNLCLLAHLCGTPYFPDLKG